MQNHYSYQGSFVQTYLRGVHHCQRVAPSDSTTDEEQDEKRVGSYVHGYVINANVDLTPPISCARAGASRIVLRDYTLLMQKSAGLKSYKTGKRPRDAALRLCAGHNYIFCALMCMNLYHYFRVFIY